MWRKAESGPIWLQTASNDALIYSPPEREDLIQESIDCLDYAEEKLLELEYSPKNMACIRRLQGTFVRLYELVWVLRCHKVFAIVQRSRAFLTYIRQGSTTIDREDVGRMFELCSVLQELLSHNRGELREEPLRMMKEASLHTKALPLELETQRVAVFQWIQRKLEGIEQLQESRVCERTPGAASLFPHNNALLQPPEEHSDASSKDCFEDNAGVSDSQELRSLKQLVGELDENVSVLNDKLGHACDASPDVGNALQNLLSLHKALQQRVDALSTSPKQTSSLFGLVVGIQDQYFCIPTSSLLALIPAVEVQVQQWRQDETQVVWNDDALPLKALSDYLPPVGPDDNDPLANAAKRAPSTTSSGFSAGPVPSSHAYCVIVETPQGPRAIWVEHLLREMMVELLHTSPNDEYPLLKGGCQLPDGQAVQLLDIAAMTLDQAAA